MKVLSLSSPLPWIVHRRNWKDFRQAFSPLWSYSRGNWADVSVRDLYVIGHAYGVRVDGAWTRPAGVKVHRIRKVQKVQRVVVDAAPQFLKSALRDWLYESYSLIRITMMSHLRWLFFPL